MKTGQMIAAWAIAAGAGLMLSYGIWGIPAEMADRRRAEADAGAGPERSPTQTPRSTRAGASDAQAVAGAFGDAHSVDTRRPVKRGDTHDWPTCAAEFADYVHTMHVARPALYLPRDAAERGELLARWRGQSGFHIHLLDSSDRSIRTIWPESDEAAEVAAMLPSEVSKILLIVPSSLQSYDFDPVLGAGRKTLDFRPEACAIAIGRTAAAGLPGARPMPEAPEGARLLVTPMTDAAIGLSLYGAPDVSAVAAELGGRDLPPVLSVGVSRGGEWTAVLYKLAIPRAARATDRLRIDILGRAGRRTIDADAPALVETVTVHTDVASAEATIRVVGAPGGRYHLSAGLWGGRGADGKPIEELRYWTLSPTSENDRRQIVRVSCAREPSAQESVGGVRVHLVPQWPE